MKIKKFNFIKESDYFNKPIFNGVKIKIIFEGEVEVTLNDLIVQGYFTDDDDFSRTPENEIGESTFELKVEPAGMFNTDSILNNVTVLLKK